MWGFFCHFVDLYLLQEKVALHKAVAEETPRCSTVLEKAGRIGPCSGISPHQLTVMRDQGLGDLWAHRGHRATNKDPRQCCDNL